VTNQASYPYKTRHYTVVIKIYDTHKSSAIKKIIDNNLKYGYVCGNYIKIMGRITFNVLLNRRE